MSKCVADCTFLWGGWDPGFTAPLPCFRTQHDTKLLPWKSEWKCHYLGIRSWLLLADCKSINKQKKAVNWCAGGSSLLSADLLSTSFGSALTKIGVPAAILFRVVGVVFSYLIGSYSHLQKAWIKNGKISTDRHTRYCTRPSPKPELPRKWKRFSWIQGK